MCNLAFNPSFKKRKEKWLYVVDSYEYTDIVYVCGEYTADAVCE